MFILDGYQRKMKLCYYTATTDGVW